MCLTQNVRPHQCDYDVSLSTRERWLGQIQAYEKDKATAAQILQFDSQASFFFYPMKTSW